jgi:hypothetical protein
LLGLRAYSSQKERAMNAIVKANAGTFQTMIVGYLGDNDISDNDDIYDCLGPVNAAMVENMVNPYDNQNPVYRVDSNNPSLTSVFEVLPALDDNHGKVDVLLVDTNILYVNGRGKDSELLLLPNALPANKY